eukprot:TRINITY_DN1075_c0_g1_i15.p2 TRINITY_DN1075_c0_g1~~TRINITY_DN1075_c0_g1_i15.p2  ORF type:complete len:115 (-),score=1.45 TRINITY_DN1075_c0_g1_i15:146-490(-)
MSIQASTKLGLKYSTAKTVLEIFSREGRIDKKGKRTQPDCPSNPCLETDIRVSPHKTETPSLFDLEPESVVKPLFKPVPRYSNYSLLKESGFWGQKLSEHFCLIQIKDFTTRLL